MKKLVMVWTAILGSLVGCGSSDGTGAQDVSLRFVAMVGDVEFSCGDSYANLGSDATTLALEDFRFYVQDVALKNSNGEWVAVELEDNQFQMDNVALLDFENGCGEVGNPDLNDRVVGVVPDGEYDGLRFKMGLPPELNHEDASTAPGILGITALFWNWRGGYKFIRIDSGNIMNNPEVWRMHLGSTGCGATDDLTTPPEQPCTNPNRVDVEFAEFDVEDNTIVADFAALVDGAPLRTNAEGTPAGCMSAPDDADCGPVFENLGLPFGDQPGGTQTFFSVD
jgi:uncharacterized repeat protein (TIGR04052 family)